MSPHPRFRPYAPSRFLSYVTVPIADAVQNARHVSGDERFLVVRDPRRQPGFYDVLLDWLSLHFPELRAKFELHTLPFVVRDWDRYALHIPWLQDPVAAWSPGAYRWANRLAAQCDRRQIPVVNRVDRLENAGKAEGARRIAAAGLRTPATARITDAAAFRATRLGLPLPLFVRRELGHGGPMLRADTDDEVRAIDVTPFTRPLAVELIDVRSDDGLYRKYRYVVAGDVGIPLSMHVSSDWCTKGESLKQLYTEALRDEDIAYVSRPEPHHDRFVAAREALELDFVAFDYGLDANGEPVVWEANPYPFIHLLGGRRRYRAKPTFRVFAAMTALYLTRAGIDVPPDLTDVVNGVDQ
ncbi:MAG: hypothetical protein QOD38_452 [Acidimicrobiaceae bacterium]